MHPLQAPEPPTRSPDGLLKHLARRLLLRLARDLGRQAQDSGDAGEVGCVAVAQRACAIARLGTREGAREDGLMGTCMRV
jgi:hypothetical protein